MKKILFLSAFIAIVSSVAATADVAVMMIKFPKEKKKQKVVIELYENAAPQTVENFKKLARKRFYNGLSFHRVFPHTLVQAGDPLSEKKDRSKVGTGGPGYTLPAEFGQKHITGAIAMSRLPDKINPSKVSSGSQFYIALKPMPELDGDYTVFGRVVEGLEVLDKASQQPADSNDNPIDKVIIDSVKIAPSSGANP